LSLFPNPNEPESKKGTMLFPRLRSEKMAPVGQLPEPKLELQLSNRDKPEITNYKHHLILKLGQINSKLQYPNLKLN